MTLSITHWLNTSPTYNYAFEQQGMMKPVIFDLNMVNVLLLFLAVICFLRPYTINHVTNNRRNDSFSLSGWRAIM